MSNPSPQQSSQVRTPAPASMPTFYDAYAKQPSRSSKVLVDSPSYPHALEDATQAGPLRVESPANISRSSSLGTSSPGTYDTQPSQLDDDYGSPLRSLARVSTQEEVGKEKHFLNSPEVNPKQNEASQNLAQAAIAKVMPSQNFSAQRKESRERLEQAWERLESTNKIARPLKSPGSLQAFRRHKNGQKVSKTAKKESTVPGNRNRRFEYRRLLAPRQSADGEFYVTVDWEPSEVPIGYLIGDEATKDAKALIEDHFGEAVWRRQKKIAADQGR